MYHLLHAQAWHTALSDSSGRHDIDLPRRMTTVTALAETLTGFGTLTRHINVVRRSLDGVGKTPTASPPSAS